jgi:hypothetical protein
LTPTSHDGSHVGVEILFLDEPPFRQLALLKLEFRGVVLGENPSEEDEAKRVATNPLDGPPIINGAKGRMLQVVSQFFSYFADAGVERRLTSLDPTAGNLPRVLVDGLDQEDAAQAIAEQASGTDLLGGQGVVVVRNTRRPIGQLFARFHERFHQRGFRAASRSIQAKCS